MSFIPINEGQTARVRTAVAICSVIGAVGSAYLAGNFENAADIIVNATINYFMSNGLYAGVLRK